MMLDRTQGMVSDHGAQMDRTYRYQRHIYDASRKYYLLGRDRMIRALDAGPGCSVLEVGCGTGRNLIAAARVWPQTVFFGLDISSAMLETATSAVIQQGLGARIALAEADATLFDAGRLFGRDQFDRIFLSYTLSMMPGWEMALNEAADLLAPGGSLHIVDFGQQEHLPRPFRSALFAWLARFDVHPRGALRAVLEEVTARRQATLTFTSLYRGYAWEATLRVGRM